MNDLEPKRRARCRQAHGRIDSAVQLCVMVYKDDLLFEGHKAELEKALSSLVIVKRILVEAAAFSATRGQ